MTILTPSKATLKNFAVFSFSVNTSLSDRNAVISKPIPAALIAPPNNLKPPARDLTPFLATPAALPNPLKPFCPTSSAFLSKSVTLSFNLSTSLSASLVSAFITIVFSIAISYPF